MTTTPSTNTPKTPSARRGHHSVNKGRVAGAATARNCRDTSPWSRRRVAGCSSKGAPAASRLLRAVSRSSFSTGFSGSFGIAARG